jgi:hypothetical protein
MGEVIATTLEYPGIRYQGLALRVAERDLRALSVPLLTGEIVVNREGANLGPGDVIRLRSARLGLDDVVMRLSEIGQGDGRDNGIRLKIAEDGAGHPGRDARGDPAACAVSRYASLGIHRHGPSGHRGHHLCPP